MKISLRIEAEGWRSRWHRAALEARAVITAAVRAGWPEAAARRELDVTCVLADDQQVRALNLRFRGKDKATNVLAFPDPVMPPGGVILGLETIRQEADEQSKPFVHHAKHLIIHGILHLAGYNHETVKERRLMERLEIAILGAMHIPNPYLIAAGRP